MLTIAKNQGFFNADRYFFSATRTTTLTDKIADSFNSHWKKSPKLRAD
jgi:hypothetical protein